MVTALPLGAQVEAELAAEPAPPLGGARPGTSPSLHRTAHRKVRHRKALRIYCKNWPLSISWLIARTRGAGLSCRAPCIVRICVGPEPGHRPHHSTQACPLTGYASTLYSVAIPASMRSSMWQ